MCHLNGPYDPQFPRHKIPSVKKKNECSSASLIADTMTGLQRRASAFQNTCQPTTAQEARTLAEEAIDKVDAEVQGY